MLTLMRKMLRSPAAGGLFLLLIVAMAAWGVTDIFSGGLGSNIVSAGKRGVTEAQFDAAVERQLRNATDDRGRSLSKEQALDQGLVDQIFARQQFDTLLRAYADELGITASEDQIKDFIVSIPAFRDSTDQFDPTLLTSYLRQEGFSQKSFEDQLEGDLTIDRLRRIPTAGLQSPEILARVEAGYNSEQRSLSWFSLSRDALPEIDEPTDEELLTLYTERQEALRIPERRGVSLIQLSVDDFSSRAQITDADVEAFYEAYKPERYTGPDTRTFTQFQFADENIARAALGRIAGGAAAEDLEGLSASNVVRGRAEIIANQRLSQQVFARQSLPGSMHGPMDENGLWTVVRLEDIEAGEVIPFADVEEAIRNELSRDQAVGFFYEALPRFDDLIGTGASLEEIGQDLGTPVLSFAPVDMRGLSESGSFYRPIAEAEGLLSSLFDLPEGEQSERTGTDEVTYLARVDSIEVERMPSFEEVKDRLAIAWRQQQEAEQLRTAADEVEARLRSGDSTLEDEAARVGTQAQSLERPITRNSTNSGLPPQIVGAAFNVRTEGDALSVPVQIDELLILQVTDIVRPAAETLDLLASTQTANIQQQLNEDLFNAFFQSLQDEIKVEIDASAYQSYKDRIVPDQ